MISSVIPCADCVLAMPVTEAPIASLSTQAQIKDSLPGAGDTKLVDDCSAGDTVDYADVEADLPWLSHLAEGDCGRSRAV